MKLNSVASSRGDYIFTTFSFGLNETQFGQMITEAILEVRKNGQGREGHKKPVLFLSWLSYIPTNFMELVNH